MGTQMGALQAAPGIAERFQRLALSVRYPPAVPQPSPSAQIEAVSAARWRMAVTLTGCMMAVYFGFILLVAFNKPLLGVRVATGLSLGMLLGASVIVVAWVLTWVYVRWANTHYDAALRRLRS